MGTIYVGLSVGFGFILFGLLLANVWIIFRNIRKRMLPENESQGVINLNDYLCEEKRKDRRVGITWPVLMETVQGMMKAKTKDLSPGGAFIVCQEPLSLGEKFRLTIEVPDKDPVNLTSEVVWSNSNVPEDRIVTRGMGIRFIQNRDEDRKYLNSAISKYLEDNEPPRLKVAASLH